MLHQVKPLNQLALKATVHCFIGCSIGEALGLIIAAILGWGNGASIALAIVLAFGFGYAFTLWSLRGSGMSLTKRLQVTLAADTISITIMEVVDNAILLIIPGAMDANVTEFLFWGSLAIALGAAFIAALPVNRWLIARGLGHAIVHHH